MTLRHCNGCDEDKELTEFYIHKSGKEIGKPRSRCKECNNKASSDWRKSNPDKSNAFCRAYNKANPDKIKSKHRAWRKANPDKVKKHNRDSSYRHGSKPASENKSSPAYLGCIIAETVLFHEFPGFKRMPYGNPNYDYDCPRGFKIDVKSSCRQPRKNGCDRWKFGVKNNKVANYFLFLAFDNRTSLNPEHLWLIPGDVVNEKTGVCITDSPKVLAKWLKYERSLNNVSKCCNKLKVVK